ncbi:DUF817 domain-containing protein [Bacillus altitudinis]|uniref:DUF817 domain-containing protein n=1 Tax=Bacillus altitudinis TaxID=293387 RepID=UPI00064C8225|nr:DUF817 domain-containing protein [Bacillus altitudinis]KLV18829.1 membrane protein [Bacillus altitudinis]
MKTLFHFAYLQAISCLFPVMIFTALALSKIVSIPFLPRYDVILLLCLIAQLLMLMLRLETLTELRVICLFHVIGIGLEIYKVHMGSWSYPEEAYTKIFGVPLYSGFMYASVASYIYQALTRLRVKVNAWPHPYLSIGISLCIYLNFFTHHWIYDLRWWLTLLLVVVFRKTTVSFQVGSSTFRMPLVISFLLIGFFIWVAENVTTFLGAWQYPNQQHAWSLVHLGKISSWFLLVVISIVLVIEQRKQKNVQPI